MPRIFPEKVLVEERNSRFVYSGFRFFRYYYYFLVPLVLLPLLELPFVCCFGGHEAGGMGQMLVS
jgi:hypothetical protein